jgi:hypothetical protein
MNAKKILAASFISLFTMTGFNANADGYDNTVYNIVMSDIQYLPKEESTNVGSSLLKIGQALLTGETSSQLSQYADAVREAVAQGIADVRRLRVVDASTGGYDYYVDGTITNITTTEKLITPAASLPYTGYRAQIRVTVNLKDRNDGGIIASNTFSTTEYSDNAWDSSQEKAINKALAVITKDIDSYLEHLYPLYAQIEEAGEAKKDKQKELYINVGSAFGVQKGDEFNVQSIKTIGTKEAHSEIGRVKVTEVMGDDISLCKVTKGGDKIKAALDAGTQIQLVAR